MSKLVITKKFFIIMIEEVSQNILLCIRDTRSLLALILLESNLSPYEKASHYRLQELISFLFKKKNVNV